MTGTFTISLSGLRFFAEHGLYQEERLVGNEFQIDVELSCEAPEETISHIDETINYVEVYRIIQELFSVRTNLLETAAMRIAAKIHESFNQVTEVRIVIRKLNPPITNFSGSVSVSFHKKFK